MFLHSRHPALKRGPGQYWVSHSKANNFSRDSEGHLLANAYISSEILLFIEKKHCIFTTDSILFFTEVELYTHENELSRS